MPQAHGGKNKYWLQDHDTDKVELTPPILNQWYTVFDADDVRLLWCWINQTNDEQVTKHIQVRWTIDGTAYFVDVAVGNNNPAWIWRNWLPSTAGTLGLTADANPMNGAALIDKRGLHFKVEVRIVTALGTNQTLTCYCVRETLEPT